jgi:hypothetical protein
MGVPGSANLLLLGGEQGYKISRSLRFNSADSAYLNRTPASAGDRKTWTFSFWIKRTTLGTEQDILDVLSGSAGNPRGYIRFTASDTFDVQFNSSGSSWDTIVTTTAVFRDVSSWYHFIVVLDATQGTASNRLKVYVNGSQITAFSSSTYPANTNQPINNNVEHRIGYAYNGVAAINGYLTEINFINGQALTPSSFGETDTITGVWKPKKYAGTYGTNGFYLNFSDNSGTTSTTLGKDSSGNSNNWTPNNFSVTAGAGNDSMIDTPTPYADGGNGRGNYCTWNAALGVGESAETANRRVCSNGSLDVTLAPWDSNRMTGTFEMRSGKWYWEIVETSTAQQYDKLGITNQQYGGRLGYSFTPSNLKIYAYENGQGKYSFVSGTTSRSSYGGNAFSQNDVIGVAFDADAGDLTFYKNGTSQGAAFTGLTSVTGSWFPMVGQDTGSFTSTWTANFGQRPFAYTPPSGFVALNTQNLPEPSIKKPSSYFDVKLYTGNGSTQTISGLGFSPDLVWLKCRSAANTHALVDSVRGVTQYLVSASTAAETTDSGGITSLNSDGFSLTFPTSSAPTINANAATYVAWCWDESATPGFDIVTYTGNATARTISHSLGVAPSFIIVKNRSNGTANWQTGSAYHNATSPWNYYMRLNSTGAAVAASTIWNNTAPTSSVFSVGTDGEVNGNGDNMIAYLWSEVAGFSKFGRYTGNGSSDGPFVFCGFRPRWILLKRTDAADDWSIYDTTRLTYNPQDLELFPNSSGAEYDGNRFVDILSNGFKLRIAGGAYNTSSSTVIFAAFAEAPFKYSLAR